MKAKFSEREYETGFNRQINVRHEIVWTPGQCQENWLGFYVAYLADEPFIFALPGLWPWTRYPTHGVRLRARDWESFFTDVEHYLPPFQFNLFVQHKRPEYLFGLNSGERDYWDGSYFRYDLDADQQVRLEALEGLMTGWWVGGIEMMIPWRSIQ